MVQCCNPLTFKPVQKGRKRSIPSKALPVKCHDKGVADSIRSSLMFMISYLNIFIQGKNSIRVVFYNLALFRL